MEKNKYMDLNKVCVEEFESCFDEMDMSQELEVFNSLFDKLSDEQKILFDEFVEITTSRQRAELEAAYECGYNAALKNRGK